MQWITLLRAYVQEWIEIRRLFLHIKNKKFRKVLEVGCGNGSGVKLIQKYFSPQETYGIDLDERMVDLTKRKRFHLPTHFQIGDVTNLPYEKDSFDAVFDFWILHHVPNWKRALEEIHRVLEPWGLLVLEDLSLDTFSTIFWRFLKVILNHPYNDMYTQKDFLDHMVHMGFCIQSQKTYTNFGTIKYFTVIAKK